MNVRGCPVSIQSRSGAGGKSKYEGNCEVDATWLKKTKEPGWQLRSLTREDGKDVICSRFPTKTLENVLTHVKLPTRDSLTMLPVGPFPASRCRRALFWVWHCLRLSLIQEK